MGSWVDARRHPEVGKTVTEPGRARSVLRTRIGTVARHRALLDRWAAIIFLASLSVPAATQGQTGPTSTTTTISSTVEPWWTMIATSFVSAAEAMPEEKYDFTPKD